jgi:4-carboxymuconolactone decarboxylase
MRRWGNVGVVELGAVIGYYTLVSMTLNVHQIPLPDDVFPPLAPLPHANDAAEALPTLARSSLSCSPFDAEGKSAS